MEMASRSFAGKWEYVSGEESRPIVNGESECRAEYEK